MKSLKYLLPFGLLISSFTSAQSVAEQQDARVIESLVSGGVDISKPREIDFFLMFQKEAGAHATARQMQQQGYTIVSIEFSPQHSLWQLYGTKRMRPQPEVMTATTRELESLAAAHDGYYEGWGTAAVK